MKQFSTKVNIPSKDNIDILFWPIEPTHMKQQLSIANILKKEKIKFKFATDRIKLTEALKQENHSSIFLSSSNKYLQSRIIINHINKRINSIAFKKSEKASNLFSFL